jgi:hypothetical protein
MAWWGLAVNDAASRVLWLNAIDDLRWALQQMTVRSLQSW